METGVSVLSYIAFDFVNHDASITFVGVFCQEVVVKDVSSDCSWNGVSCSAQVRPSRPGC